MRKISAFPSLLLSTICALGLMTCVVSAQLSGSLTNGLVAYFPFNGNTSDQSGSNLSLSLSDASLAVDRFGESNKAIGFLNGMSTAAFAYSLADRSFSIGAWWYQPNFSMTEAGGFAQGMVGEPGKAFRLMTDYYSVGLRYSFWFDDFDADFSRTRSEWLHIVATFDNSTSERRIYLNGILFGSNTAAYGFSGTGDLQFGFMTGSMDEIRVYNRVLSIDEVGSIYANESVPEPSTYALLLLSGAASLWALKRRRS